MQARVHNEKKFPEVQRFSKFADQDPTIDDFKALIGSLMAGGGTYFICGFKGDANCQ